MKEDRSAFFRQSTWLLIATVGGSAFMFFVQFVAQRFMPKDASTGETQFSLFMALLNALAQMSIPALGLQTVFAQQAGAATNDQRHRELVGTVRGVLKTLFGLWLVFAIMAFVFQSRLLSMYKIPNPAALWFTVGAAFLAMATPVFGGLLQGRQDFFWFGWNSIFNGVGRFVAVVLFVVVMGFEAAGAMGGVFFGLAASFVLFAWRTQPSWRGPAAPVKWSAWLKRVVPLTVGLGTYTFMLTRDPIVVQAAFTDSGGYNAARIVGTALVFLTTPLAAVMFPKIARSHALSEKSNVLMQALGAVGVLGGLAAIACTILPALPLRVMSGTKFIDSAWLVPWCAWCMLPLAVANVLMNNLFARERYGAVPWLVAVAVAYGITLEYRHSSYLQVIQTLGVFGLLLVGVCVVFTLLTPTQQTPPTAAHPPK